MQYKYKQYSTYFTFRICSICIVHIVYDIYNYGSIHDDKDGKLSIHNSMHKDHVQEFALTRQYGKHQEYEIYTSNPKLFLIYILWKVHTSLAHLTFSPC